MIDGAAEVVALADHDKLGTAMPIVVAPLSAVTQPGHRRGGRRRCARALSGARDRGAARVSRRGPRWERWPRAQRPRRRHDRVLRQRRAVRHLGVADPGAVDRVGASTGVARARAARAGGRGDRDDAARRPAAAGPFQRGRSAGSASPGLMVAVLLPGLARSVPALAVALLVMGVTNSTLDLAMNAQGMSVERRMKRPILSSLHAAFSFGGFAGAGLGALAAALVGRAAPAPRLRRAAVRDPRAARDRPDARRTTRTPTRTRRRCAGGRCRRVWSCSGSRACSA